MILAVPPYGHKIVRLVRFFFLFLQHQFFLGKVLRSKTEESQRKRGCDLYTSARVFGQANG